MTEQIPSRHSISYVFDAIAEIVQVWADAYPVEQFGEQLSGFDEATRLSEHMALLGPYSVGRISGAMGRHMATCILKQIADLRRETEWVEK